MPLAMTWTTTSSDRTARGSSASCSRMRPGFSTDATLMPFLLGCSSARSTFHGTHGQPFHQRALGEPAQDQRRKDDKCRDGAQLRPEEPFLGHEARHVDRDGSGMHVCEVDGKEKLVPDKNEHEEPRRNDSLPA